MSKYLFCEKCKDLVLKTDTKPLSEIYGSAFKSSDEEPIHFYYKLEDHGLPFHRQRTGYQRHRRLILCGKVREPTPEEYFILYTSNPKRK